MTQNWLDISETIDARLVSLFEAIQQATDSLGIPFVVVGATARDVILGLYEVTPARATRDVDIAIRVQSWNDYGRLRELPLATDTFVPTTIRHRLLSRHGIPLDMVPFGQVADEDGQIRWPDAGERVMRVLGFEEAFAWGIIVCVQTNPMLAVRVASLPGIAMTKLVSWFDQYPARIRDALDLHLILSQYIDAGGLERLSTEAADLIESDREIDIELAGARLLGRDIARMAQPATLTLLREILRREAGADEDSRLVRDMVGRFPFSERGVFSRAAELLHELERGVREERHSTQSG